MTPTPFDPFTDLPLQAMMKQAEAGGKWFFCHYQQLWFSPAELRAQWQSGSFCWGAVNWKLRDPAERETELKQEIEAAQLALAKFTARRERISEPIYKGEFPS